MNCEKKNYQCRKIAKKKARWLTLKEWKKFIVYKCEKCLMFHLTTRSSIDEKEYFRIHKLRAEVIRLQNDDSNI